MKKLIMATVITVCLALCAVMWPQSEATGEGASGPKRVPVMNVPKEVPMRFKVPVEVPMVQAEEKTPEPPKPEPPMETVPEPEPVPTETPVVPEARPTPEPNPPQSLCPSLSQRKRLRTSKPETWFMYRALAGWRVRGRTR